MDALIEQVEFTTLDMSNADVASNLLEDRSVVGMDKVWYNCTDDYLD
jgi:hypothetical protein